MQLCKKETTLSKHMITTHQEHPCKDCKEKLSTFMQLLKHVAKHHCKEQDKEEAEDDIIEKKGDHGEVEDKEVKSDFVFHESMLDEFISQIRNKKEK